LQMEKDDKGSTLIRIGVSGESSFWYWPTRVVPDQRPLNGRCNMVVYDTETMRCSGLPTQAVQINHQLMD